MADIEDIENFRNVTYEKKIAELVYRIERLENHQKVNMGYFSPTVPNANHQHVENPDERLIKVTIDGEVQFMNDTEYQEFLKDTIRKKWK